MSPVDARVCHVWYPCTDKSELQQFVPLTICKASGSYLELADGSRIIDAISSWWCKSLGHGHPKLRQALWAQVQKFEHIMMPGTIHDNLTLLSQLLTELSPGLSKVFYASDGASAVEIALKMSLHTRVNNAQAKRCRFIALENGYHGETIGALSVSDVGLYKKAYQSLLFEPYILNHVPYVVDTSDPTWHNCEDVWPKVLEQLNHYAKDATAIILEPIIQGAAGMRLYSQDFLSRIASWAKENDIHIIVDEIMTGLGRTGKMLASEYAGITPDFICLSKGLTAGWLPLSAVLTRENIYQQCYIDNQPKAGFLHSHTYSGNALAISVAVATLQVIQEDRLCEKAIMLQEKMRHTLQMIANETGMLVNIRGIGAIIAADFLPTYARADFGFRIFQEAIKRGAWLRPIANTLYWLPPLNIPLTTLDDLAGITRETLLALKQ